MPRRSSIDELPPIKGVILSHNHYDHLDHAAILQLAGKTEHFLTPLGVGDQLIAWGVEAAKVQQLDWWQSTNVDGIRFVATPSQHFSGRGLGDGKRPCGPHGRSWTGTTCACSSAATRVTSTASRPSAKSTARST